VPHVVELRPLVEDDRDRLLAWRNSPEVASQMYSGGEISPSTHAAWFDGARQDQTHRYRVVEWHGQPVGLVYLTDVDMARRSCEWGGYIGESAARGKGLARQMLVQSLRLAFEDLSLNKVRVEALAANARAIGLYERTGFRREGYYREHVWKDGVPHDVVALALLASEWELLLPGIHGLLARPERMG
jgi:UDP-4-amino-4,6-dideoxy-N-acetyl-beta-L-altrosamine N-acetyltransferase